MSHRKASGVPSGTPTRLALSPELAALRAALRAAGVTAESPDRLDAEAERLARDERRDR